MGNRYTRVGRAVSISALALVVSATSTLATAPIVPTGNVGTISGIGATFPSPLYNEWFAQFNADLAVSSPSSTVAFTYAANGSGAGVNAIKNGTADYGASDAALSDADVAATASTNGGVLHIPATLGGVVLAYKLAGVKTSTGAATTLKLTPGLVFRLYSGQIKYWDDTLVKGINPGVVIPHTLVTPVHRSDSSGTTFVFESYLAKVSSVWRCIFGTGGPTKAWPSSPSTCTGLATLPGLGAPRNSGVAAKVASTNGAIGYMEYAYAQNAGLKMARLKNPAGTFVSPSTYAFSAAANATVATIPADLRAAPIVQAPGTTSWPISAYSYIFVYKQAEGLQGASEAKAQMFVAYLNWALTTGQSFSRSMGYAPLPTSVRTKALAQVHQITWGGSAIWP